jgi:serine/threonine-protein phosphatase 2A regulatory subunit A
LSAHLGRAFFEEELAKLSISWLNDVVFAVRETAVESVKRIMQQFGSEWTVQSGLLQQLLEYAQHRNYLRRMTLLSALSQTCSVVEAPVVSVHFVPILEKLASDPIANVRFNVAKALQAVVPILIAASEGKEVLRTPIVPILQELQRDTDPDVRDHATLALNSIPVF